MLVCWRLLGAALLVTAVAACSSEPPGTAEPPSAVTETAVKPSPAEARTVEAAQAVVKLSVDRYLGGDYAGAWDLYTAEGKAAITRDEYVRLLSTCPPPSVPYEIVSARLEGENRAVVVVKLLGMAQSYETVYEQGVWRFQPTKAGLASYAKGVDALIAEQKANGNCR